MPDPLGISFAPGQDGQQQNGQKPTPIQQAIQTLSLRIPRVVGAGSIAPQQTLGGPGGSALGGNPNSAAMLEAIRRFLFGGGMPTPGGGMPGGPPMPPVTGGPTGGAPGGSVPRPGIVPGGPGPQGPLPRDPDPGPTWEPPPPPAPAQPPRLGPGVGPPRQPREPGDRRF